MWFRGGGFTSGSGGWDWYDGRNLAAACDIVVVTANYRLGPLGYLYLPELGIENLGTQDQAACGLGDDGGHRFRLRHVDGVAGCDLGHGGADASGLSCCAGGGIMRSSLVTRYQLGLGRQAGR